MLDMPYHQGRELPEFTIRQIDLPEILSWETNGEYYLVMKVKMTGKRGMDHLPANEDKDKLVGEFKVKTVRAIGHEPIDIKSIEKADFEMAIAKAKTGRY